MPDDFKAVIKDAEQQRLRAWLVAIEVEVLHGCNPEQLIIMLHRALDTKMEPAPVSNP